MNSNKRGRGRPIGSGLNDAPRLEKVADLLVAKPSLKPTTAIRRVLANPGPSEIRRLQMKWKSHSAEYLFNARARNASASPQVTVRRSTATNTPNTILQQMEAYRQAYFATTHAIRAAQEMLNNPALLAAQEAAWRYHKSPAMRAIDDYRNSPAIRAIMEFQNSPTMRAMRSLHDSPVMRASREVSEQLAEVQRLAIGSRF